MKLVTLLLTMLAIAVTAAAAGVVYEGKDGPGKGKHVVLLSGDEEYRSEEAMTLLGRTLAVHHGFKCTVLYSIDPKTGEIDPTVKNNIPGIEALDTADMCVMSLRFRELPDEQMKHFVDYLNAGKPILALRTSTHAFAYSKDSKSAYAKFDWKNKEWPGGFGRQVLGETWVAHHGWHAHEATLGVVEPSAKGPSHPPRRDTGVRADGRLHRQSARRLQHHHARPGVDRHEADRPAGRRQTEADGQIREEQPYATGGLAA